MLLLPVLFKRIVISTEVTKNASFITLKLLYDQFFTHHNFYFIFRKITCNTIDLILG